MFFFFNDTATTEIYTLSLHDALPIYHGPDLRPRGGRGARRGRRGSRHKWPHRRPPPLPSPRRPPYRPRSEEHTSELQSRQYLVCRLLLEKKHEPYSEAVASLTSTTLS